MANKNVKAQIRSARTAVSYENGDLFQFASKVTYKVAAKTSDVMDVRSGLIGEWQEPDIDGTLEFSFENADLTALKEWLNLANDGTVPVAGFKPTRRVRLHLEGDADATKDILFYALSWGEVRNETTGEGVLVYVVTARLLPDDSGKYIKVGATF